jgi:uncharacterized protein
VSRTLRLSSTETLIISAVGAAGGIAWLLSRGTAIPQALVISLCGGAVLGGILVLGIHASVSGLRHRLEVQPAHVLGIVAGLWGLYLLYSIGTATAAFAPLAFMALYLSIPFLLLMPARGSSGATWQDAVTILWVWLPIEFGIVKRLIPVSTTNTDFTYSFVQALAMISGVIAFAAWRRLPGIGYRLEFDRKKSSEALLAFALFAAIAIPLGFAIHFIDFMFEWRKVLFAPAAFVGIFLFIAIPEELLFRGLIQNCLERTLARRYIALMFAAIIFGASHLNNGPPIPNHRYFLMATIAGVFYGLVWQRTRNIAAAAITHALVDTAWSALFR